MSDQVGSLKNRWVCAAIISSGHRIDDSVQATELELLIPGKYNILFFSSIIGVSKWQSLLSFPIDKA